MNKTMNRCVISMHLASSYYLYWSFQWCNYLPLQYKSGMLGLDRNLTAKIFGLALKTNKEYGLEADALDLALTALALN